MATLFLICGLPGSGKSTVARRLEQEHHALRLTPDEWMERIVGHGRDEEQRAAIEAIQRDLAQRLLQLGVNVVLESGFWSRAERDEVRARATAIGAEVELYFLDVPRAELVRRLHARNESLPPNTFPVDPSELDEWERQFEPPTDDESPRYGP